MGGCREKGQVLRRSTYMSVIVVVDAAMEVRVADNIQALRVHLIVCVGRAGPTHCAT